MAAAARDAAAVLMCAQALGCDLPPSRRTRGHIRKSEAREVLRAMKIRSRTGTRGMTDQIVSMSDKEDKEARSSAPETIRLNRLISQAGLGSRREADRWIEEGRVCVDGQRGVPGQKVTADQTVTLDGRPVTASAAEERIIAVNKPAGYVCTTDRRWGDPLLEDLVDVPERLFSVGRLDKQSEGLILMTNQGDLPNRILRSRYGHEKEYVVRIDRPVSRTFTEQMSRGVYLEELDVTTRPCRVTQTGKDEIHIVLNQGLNRQIRRMCRACGARVISLKRIRIMNICLGDLPEGQWRDLTKEERTGLERALNE